MSDAMDRLGPEQRDLLGRWIPDLEVIADHSWKTTGTTVLEVRSDKGRLIVKAGDTADGHIARELRAHREWLAPWVATGRGPTLVHGDLPAKLLIARFVPGRLVEGTAAQHDPDAFRQAGELLAALHQQASTFDRDWHDQFRARVQRDLDRPHRIDPELERQLRAEVSKWPGGGSRVVPTHGDWQPRNWLVDDDGVVRVIDLGRADLRPPTEDFVRLAGQDFDRDPELEAAFLEGYGVDPRTPEQWRRDLLGQAVGTAVWAYSVRDAAFEEHGHALLASLYGEGE